MVSRLEMPYYSAVQDAEMRWDIHGSACQLAECRSEHTASSIEESMPLCWTKSVRIAKQREPRETACQH